MSEEENKDIKKTPEPKKGQRFDMYHFFSRNDVILAIGVILALLVFLLSLYLQAETV